MTERMEESIYDAGHMDRICQIASAVFPGTSALLSTIAAGQVAGMSRLAALEFSFFLSIPTRSPPRDTICCAPCIPSKERRSALSGKLRINGRARHRLVVSFIVARPWWLCS